MSLTALQPRDLTETRRVLHEILRQDIQLWFEGEDLHFKTPGEPLSGAVRELLRAHKSDLRQIMGAGRKYARASSAQKRLWFFHQYDPSNPVYNLPALALRISGPLDIEALKQALNVVVRRHEALRTTFEVLHGEPVQVVADAMDLPLQTLDLSDLPEDAREGEAQRIAVAEVRRPFDLCAGPLLRATVICLRHELMADGVAQHLLLVPIHHIVVDGWSIGIILRELFGFYDAYANECSASLPEVGVQYSDYTLWRRHQISEATLAQQLEHWKERLRDAPTLLTLPADRERPAAQSWQGRELPFRFEGEVPAALRALASELGVSLFMILLAGFKATVKRYTGESDIVIGSGTANRRRPELSGVVGFFVNTLVLRTDLSGSPSFRQLIQRVREVALDAYEHQDLPFDQVVQAVGRSRDLSQNSLFQLAFILQNLPVNEVQVEQLSLKRFHVDPGTAQFDVLVAVEETTSGLEGTIQYNTDIFDEETITQFILHYQRMLAAAAAEPDKPIELLPLLTPEETAALLQPPQPKPLTPPYANLQELFDAQCANAPEGVAVLTAQAQHSYSEIHRRANQLARHLQSLGLGADDIVGVCMDRGCEQAVAVLAVLKSGAALLPLDPLYPLSRIRFMLQDAGAAVVLAQPKTQEAVTAAEAPVLLLDHLADQLATYSCEPVVSAAQRHHLAYVIYTSGSTGAPKAAMLEQESVLRLAQWQRAYFRLGGGTRILQFAPMGFDAFVWEFLETFGAGATLCYAPAEDLVPGPALAATLLGLGITMVTLPPSALAELPLLEYPALKQVIAGGEACTAALARNWCAKAQFYNAYGPAEATVCSAIHDDVQPERPRVIGHPTADFQFYVLDGQGMPVPDGVPGELFLAGPGVGRGYLNRPELTAGAFVTLQLPEHAPVRAYRSGDIVCRRRDGRYEFIGRRDQQVKVRGCRIELAEVESALQQAEGVKDAVVISQGAAGLVAFWTGEANIGEQLLLHLRRTLPQHMCPAQLIHLDVLPVTPNGKLDRQRLQQWSVPGEIPSEAVEAPRSATECTVASIVAELLHREAVGRDQDFFLIGGHSLLAAQLVSRLEERFGVQLALRSLFEDARVSAIALSIEKLLSRRDRADAVDGMTEQEVDAMLAAMLGNGGDRT